MMPTFLVAPDGRQLVGDRLLVALDAMAAGRRLVVVTAGLPGRLPRAVWANGLAAGLEAALPMAELFEGEALGLLEVSPVRYLGLGVEGCQVRLVDPAGMLAAGFLPPGFRIVRRGEG